MELYQEFATSRGSPSKSPSNCGKGRSRLASGIVALPYCESGSLKIAGPALKRHGWPPVAPKREQKGLVTGVKSESEGAPVPPMARKVGSLMSLANRAEEMKSLFLVLAYPPNGRCVLRFAE